MGTVLLRVSFILLLLFVLHPSLLLAQTAGQMDGVVSPASPGPDQPFTVTLESFSTDLSRAFITWRRSGTVVAQGLGLKTLSAVAPNAGTEMRITASAETKDVGRIEKTFVIKPASLELLYQAETYTHPFYKGKALPTAESQITLVALPGFLNSRGARIPPSELIFTWKRNGRVLDTASGAGKSIFTFEAPSLSESMPLMEVEVRTVSGTETARAELLLPLSEPQIVFYEQNDLLGTLVHRALPSTFVLATPEIGLAAYPYFLGSRLRDNEELAYTWGLNGSTLSGNKSSLITLRKPEESGESVLSLTVDKIGSIFGTASKTLRLRYEN